MRLSNASEPPPPQIYTPELLTLLGPSCSSPSAFGSTPNLIGEGSSLTLPTENSTCFLIIIFVLSSLPILLASPPLPLPPPLPKCALPLVTLVSLQLGSGRQLSCVPRSSPVPIPVLVLDDGKIFSLSALNRFFEPKDESAKLPDLFEDDLVLLFVLGPIWDPARTVPLPMAPKFVAKPARKGRRQGTVAVMRL